MSSARRPPVVSEMSGRRGSRNSGLVVRTPAVPATAAEKAAVKPLLEAPAPAPAPAPAAGPDAPQQCDVYATAQQDVSDKDGVSVARAGERVRLFYPMRELAPGKVSMTLRSAHPDTGQLGDHEVLVYALDDKYGEIRPFGQFSTCP